jgi:hypothetical protein
MIRRGIAATLAIGAVWSCATNPARAWAGRCYSLAWDDPRTKSMYPDRVTLDSRHDSLISARVPVYALSPVNADTTGWSGVTTAFWGTGSLDSVALVFLGAHGAVVAHLRSAGDSLFGRGDARFASGVLPDSSSFPVSGRRVAC